MIIFNLYLSTFNATIYNLLCDAKPLKVVLKWTSKFNLLHPKEIDIQHVLENGQVLLSGIWNLSSHKDLLTNCAFYEKICRAN